MPFNSSADQCQGMFGAFASVVVAWLELTVNQELLIRSGCGVICICLRQSSFAWLGLLPFAVAGHFGGCFEKKIG